MNHTTVRFRFRRLDSKRRCRCAACVPRPPRPSDRTSHPVAQCQLKPLTKFCGRASICFRYYSAEFSHFSLSSCASAATRSLLLKPQFSVWHGESSRTRDMLRVTRSLSRPGGPGPQSDSEARDFQEVRNFTGRAESDMEARTIMGLTVGHGPPGRRRADGVSHSHK
eukprot:50260-Hanusia_phi.AAC.1